MLIETLRFGKVEVDDAQTFSFPVGILGFTSLKSYVVIETEEHDPFKWLQSIEDPEVAFLMGDPLLFYPSYRAEIRRQELKPIDPEVDEECALSAIITLPDHRPLAEASANLRAPLIFNLAKRRGMQYVLNDRKFPVKYFLFKEPPPPIKSSDDSLDQRSLSLR